MLIRAAAIRDLFELSGTFETVSHLDVLAMTGKLCYLVTCFLIIIHFAESSCCD
jgi:hypothetical protein